PPPSHPFPYTTLFRSRPADNPREEHARLVQLGKEAFVAQQYGRAAERFRQAIAVMNDAPANFLLAQTEFALGKFFDAVDAIQNGDRKSTRLNSSHRTI